MRERTKPSVRTTVDIPAPLYRKLKEQAAAQGCSARQLILRGVEKVLLRPRSSVRRRERFPLIGEGPAVPVSNDLIYEHVEFP